MKRPPVTLHRHRHRKKGKTGSASFETMANMTYSIPEVFVRALKEIVGKMGVPSRVKDGLKKRLASVQVVLLTGERRDGIYPSHEVTYHRDAEAFPQGGVLAVFLHASKPGALRVIRFRGLEETQPELHLYMHQNSAYFMGENLFSRHGAAYDHAAETLLGPDDMAYVLLYRFWDERESRRLRL